MNPIENPVEETTESDQLRALMRGMSGQVEKEKSRLAREIHDGLSQTLSELSMRVWFLDACLKEETPDCTQARQMSQELTALVEGIVTSTVAMEGKIAPRLKEFGFLGAVEWQGEQFQKRTGIVTQLSVSGTDTGLSGEAGLEVYRVIEEILTNASIHSGASRIEIRLAFRRSSSGLFVEISDNGIGMTDEQWAGAKSLGWLEVRERVRALGGNAQRIPAVRGTTIQVCVPMPTASAKMGLP